MSFYRTYILPGLIFQSVIVGGGYATGRELVEFFFGAGPVGGLLGITVSGAIFGLALALGFEFARQTGSYDYKSFSQKLLGPGWFVYEIAYFLLLLLVLSVVGSAAGILVSDAFDISPLVGTLALILLVVYLVFRGAGVIKRVLAGWSLLLYAVYIALVLLVFQSDGDALLQTMKTAGVGKGWAAAGFMYSGYNLAILPTVLFVVTGHTSRRQTLGAGMIAGALAVIPALLFYVAMMSKYPEIGDQAIPSAYLMEALGIEWLSILFQIVVFGTFVETGAALLHAVNDRISHAKSGGLSPAFRALVSALFLVGAIFLAEAVGIVSLIAEGYTLLTYAFLGCLVLPLLIVGGWTIARSEMGRAS